MHESFTEKMDLTDSSETKPIGPELVPDRILPPLEERIADLKFELAEIRKQRGGITVREGNLTLALGHNSQVKYEPLHVTKQKRDEATREMLELMSKEKVLEKELSMLIDSEHQKRREEIEPPQAA